MAQIIPHRHRRISYGPTLAKYIREDACHICSRYPSWREHLAALLRLLANRLDGGVW